MTSHQNKCTALLKTASFLIKSLIQKCVFFGLHKHYARVKKAQYHILLWGQIILSNVLKTKLQYNIIAYSDNIYIIIVKWKSTLQIFC
jgi:hypothetical protein